MTRDVPIAFDCGGSALIGMVHLPDPASGAPPPRRGVLIVVGGPQYRTGSHRQFLLLARALADAGIPAMRFDYRGLGDSGGDFAGFEAIDDDIRAAADAFSDTVPALEEIVLWGLCDAASAILFYAHNDPRIAGAVLLNPWVRSEAGYAKTQLKHYYLRRLASGEFWRKIFAGRLDIAGAFTGFFGAVKKASEKAEPQTAARGQNVGAAADSGNPLADRMADGLHRFAKPTLLIMSGRDLTAREFEDAASASPPWREMMAGADFVRRDLPPADHTFSRRAWRDQVAEWTRDWVAALPGTPRS